MSAEETNNSRIEGMLRQRADAAERTRKDLEEALNRFEKGRLQKHPRGTKLTLRTLAVESGHSKDTPLSRYRKGEPNAGEYRFPTVASRFKKLTSKQTQAKDKETLIQRLQRRIRELRTQLLQSVRANNLLDAENVELKRRNRELEEDKVRLSEENAQLRRGDMRVMTTAKS
jgi:hypothetical protein